MSDKPRLTWLYILITVAVVIIIVVVGCNLLRTPPAVAPVATQTPLYTATPTQEPTPHHSSVVLPDGSKILLGQDAKIEVISQPGIPINSRDISVVLLQGEIMVIPNLPEESWFLVQKPGGYTARIQGCAMIVDFDDALNTMYVGCIAGNCGISPDQVLYHTITADMVWSYQGGFPFDPVPIDYGVLYNKFGDDIPGCVAAEQNMPTPQVGSGTPTPEATATVQYTGTPTPDLAATATEACVNFHKQFPATPCP